MTNIAWYYYFTSPPLYLDERSIFLSDEQSKPAQSNYIDLHISIKNIEIIYYLAYCVPWQSFKWNPWKITKEKNHYSVSINQITSRQFLSLSTVKLATDNLPIIGHMVQSNDKLTINHNSHCYLMFPYHFKQFGAWHCIMSYYKQENSANLHEYRK